MTELNELFADVAPDIQESIRELGWHTPTPVQAAAIPRMRAGGDLIVQAQTGSGKTGAFGIPLVENIDTELAETQAIVLLPTRELANQVAVELDQLGQHRGVHTLPIYGGVAYGPQLEGLERGAHIVVGTPGRILDHLKNGRMDLSNTKVLVLDEADEMLSLGFWPDMKEVASFLPKKRQSHLFSATMPEKVRSLSRFFLTDAEDITIEVEGGSPQKISHYYYLAPASEKEALLARILEYEDPDSAIIFCNTKADVRFITAYLAKRGHNVDQISGDLQQSAREKAIGKIKAGKLRYLVATDVAARGIDISDLSYVINYTTSDSPEVYVHRTGRTGRAGKSGVAISIVSGLDIGNFKYMQVVSGIKIAEKKAPTDRDIARRRKQREKQKAEGKAEDEIKTLKTTAEQALGLLDPSLVSEKVEMMLPLVRKSAESEEGMRELAGICVAYLQQGLADPQQGLADPQQGLTDQPAAVEAAVTEAMADDSGGTRSDGAEEITKADPASESESSSDRPRRRRRPRRSDSGGDASSTRTSAAASETTSASERPRRRRRSRNNGSGTRENR
jgi:ATP-dependent RNA helicase DeaD